MSSTFRIGVVGSVFVALLVVLGVRLWTMQITEVHAYEERAERQQVRLVMTPSPRGDIYDVNGTKLAGTLSSLAVVVDLALVDESEIGWLSENLGTFLDEPTSVLVTKLSGENRGAQITVAEDISDAQAVFLLEHREDFPGLMVIPQPVRTYPLGEVAAHVIGYIGRPNEEDLERDDVEGNDFVGRAGVEKSYDVQLQGSDGVIQYRVDAKRNVLYLMGEATPTAGGSLILTIDVKVQAQLQDSLRDGLAQARKLEMEERAVELAESSRTERLAEALTEAREEALLEEDGEGGSGSGEDELGVDDDDVVRDLDPVIIDPAKVLGPLNTSLPVDSDGVCVPADRISVTVGGRGTLSGVVPRVVRLEAVDEVDGDYVATISVSGTTVLVKANEYLDDARQTLQVLHLSEDELVLLHKDPWCPVRATGVVIDPNDGSVVAMSSFPTYDPAMFIGGLSTEDWVSLGTLNAFQNFAIQGLYAPASTFKVVPYVLAVEESFYPMDRGSGDKLVGDETDQDEQSESVPLLSDTDEYFCGGEFKFVLSDGTVQRKRDWKWPYSHGLLDLHGALEASCDLYFWDLALRLWEERNDDSGIDKENLLQGWARSFGFGSATGVDLPFEQSGLVPDSDWYREEQRAESGRVRSDGPWVGGDLMDIAVGQGSILVTPLQLANGFAAMVNGGTVWQPYVVSQIVNSDGEVIDENQKTVLTRVDLAPETVSMLLDDLQQVVNNRERGTARTAFIDFGENVELVGGKTGTGEVIKAPRSERFRQVDNALFVGVAPIDSPEWVVSVVVERGGSGGRVAAPIARQVLQYLLNGPEGVTELAPGLDAD